MSKLQYSNQKGRKNLSQRKKSYNDLTEIVYDGRHKAFGGYVLRRHYNERLLIAAGIGIFILILLTLPLGIGYFWPQNEEEAFIQDSVVEIPLGGPEYKLASKSTPPASSSLENEKLAPKPVENKDTTRNNKQNQDTTKSKKSQAQNNSNNNGQQNSNNNNGGGGGGGKDEKGKIHADILNKKELMRLVVTEYPAEEKILGHEDNSIVVAWLVHEDGSTSDFSIKTSKGNKKLNDAAIKIAQKAHCIPALVNGVPAKEVISIPVAFRLR